MRSETLETLRSELAARLGYASQGASIGQLQSNIDNALFNAQQQLYWQHDWRYLTKYSDKTIGDDQTLVDYPTDCNPLRVLNIAVLYNSIYMTLEQGIPIELYTTLELPGPPKRYEARVQIEVWPKTDQSYSLRLWYIKNLAAFTQNNDVTTIDADLVFLHALSNLKAHYRHPDAASYASQFNELLGRMKAKNQQQNVVHFGDHAEVITQRPLVVGRDI